MIKHKFLIPVVLIFCAGLGAQDPQAPSSTTAALSNPESSPAINGSVSDDTKLPGEETGELRVYVGKSVLVSSREMLRRVSVTNPEIASATIVTPTQVLIHGHKPGAVTLLLWDQQDRPRSFDLNVGFDTLAIRDTLQQAFPQEKISVN